MRPNKLGYALNAGIALLLWVAVAAVIYMPISIESNGFYGLVGLAITATLYPLIRWVVELVPDSILDKFVQGDQSSNPFSMLYDDVIPSSHDRASEELTDEEKRQQLFEWANGDFPRLQLAPKTTRGNAASIVQNADNVDSLLRTFHRQIPEVDGTSPVAAQLEDAQNAFHGGLITNDSNTNQSKIFQEDDQGSTELRDELSTVLNCKRSDSQIKTRAKRLQKESEQISTVSDALEPISNTSIASLEQHRSTSQSTDRLSTVIEDIQEEVPPTNAGKELQSKITNLLGLLETAVQEINEQKGQKEKHQRKAKEFSKSVETISRELDMGWVRDHTTDASTAERSTEGGEALNNSDTQVGTAKLLSKAVSQGVVGERVSVHSATELLDEKSLTTGSVEYKLLDAIRNSNPTRLPKHQLEQTVEILYEQTIISDSIDTSISEADVQGVAKEVESKIAEIDVGRLQGALSSHITRTVQSVQNAHGDNPVPAYIAYRHLSDLRDVLRPIRSDDDSEIDMSAVESKASEIEELSQQFDDITAGHRIPDHFLTVVESLRQEARNAKRDGRKEYAEGVLKATAQLQDGIIDLYRNRRLRKKLVQM